MPTLASSPIFEFPIFENLVGDNELSAYVVAIFSFNSIVEEATIGG